ncbi:iron ABC transporter permease [Suicoccus acidiformans]|uniref:Iron ABC transporter permease n=1 Tax=Suicoccus acidiformans TaxID=2036206 RepID=A0A347WJK5_9LACT|nr:iron chelate uptake ABC transporter family permease subunit [Suicoccus acidiformans]AXY25262.1 iron ABC transporter permease [Suicoccus acidiformans]
MSQKTLAFQKAISQKRYRVLLGTLLFLAVGLSLLYLIINIPVAPTSASFWPIVKRRIVSLLAMLAVSIGQSAATVTFQSFTQNRLITPSLLGFDALYALINTMIIFFLGTRSFLEANNFAGVILSILIMIGVSLFLYGGLLLQEFADVQFVLLIGAVIGIGLRALTNFMQSLLSPSQFDMLKAKLLGSVNNANATVLPLALLVLVSGLILLMRRTQTLNTLSLGRDISINLGLHYKKELLYFLTLVTLFMAVSTALVGSMNFYGFLVAMLTYECVPTYDHRYLLPVACLLGFVMLLAAYLVMNHLFQAQGVVSVVIELVGGFAFLSVLLRRGRSHAFNKG